MPQLELTSTGVASVVADLKKVERAIVDQATATQKVATAEQNLEAIGRQVTKNRETAQERYNRLLSLTEKLHKDGHISAETRTRDIEGLNKELKNSEGQFKKFAEKQDDAFGSKSLDKIKSFVLGFATVQTALAAARAVIQGINADIAAGQAVTASGTKSIGELKQVSANQEEFTQLTKLARTLFKEGAAGDLGEAAGLVFSLKSAGQLADTGLFAELRKGEVISNAAVLANSVNATKQALGETETGSTAQIIAKGFAASDFASATVEQLLQASSVPGSFAKTLQLTDEENLAAVTAASRPSKSVEVGATQVRALLAAALKDSELADVTKATGLEGLIEALRDRQASVGDAGLVKSLGSVEAFTGFSTLSAALADSSNQGLGSILGKINAVSSEDAARTAINAKVAFSDPETDAARLDRRRKQSADAIQETRGAFESLLDSVQARRATETEETLRRGGADGATIQIKKIGDSLVDNFRQSFRGGGVELVDLYNQGKLTEEEGSVLRELVEKNQRQLNATENGNKTSEKIADILTDIEANQRKGGGLPGGAD